MPSTKLSKNEIIGRLPKLSKPDLAAVHAATAALLGPTGAQTGQAGTPLFDVICRTLGLRMAFSGFSTGQAGKQFRAGERAVNDFVLANFVVPNGMALHRGLLHLIIDSLIDDLKERQVPISMGTVCSNLERAPQCFKAAFPGYIESGHGNLIVKSLTKQKSDQ